MVSLNPQFLSYLMDKGVDSKDESREKEKHQNASIIQEATAADGQNMSLPIKLS